MLLGRVGKLSVDKRETHPEAAGRGQTELSHESGRESKRGREGGGGLREELWNKWPRQK